MRTLSPWFMPLLLVACTGKGSDDSTSPDSTGDTGDSAATPTGPCDGGGWGPFDGPEDLLVVASSGTSDAAGGWDDPVDSLDAALAQVTAGVATRVLFGPEDFQVESAIAGADTPLAALGGCGRDVTTLTATSADSYVLKLSGVETRLAGFSTSGGRRAIWVEGESNVQLSDVRIDRATRTGLLVFGHVTASLGNLEVLDTEAEVSDAGSMGVGISIEGASVETTGLAGISMEEGLVQNSTGVGILVDKADVTLTGVTVTGTQTDDSQGLALLGRGVQAQNFSYLHMSGCTISDNADAGVFSLGSVLLDISGSSIIGTAAAGLPDGTASLTGDGVVAARGDDDGWPVSTFHASLTDSVVDGNARTGMLLEDVTLDDASGNSGANLYDGGLSVVYQGDADVSADTADVAPVTGTLDLNRSALSPDEGR